MKGLSQALVHEEAKVVHELTHRRWNGRARLQGRQDQGAPGVHGDEGAVRREEVSALAESER